MMQQAISHWIGAGPQGATGHSLESVMHNRGKRACAFDLPRSALGLTRWRGFPEGSSLGNQPHDAAVVPPGRLSCNDPRPKAIGASFASCECDQLHRASDCRALAHALWGRRRNLGAALRGHRRDSAYPISMTTQPLVFFEPRLTGMALGGYYALEWDENGCAVSRPKQKLLDYSAHRGR